MEYMRFSTEKYNFFQSRNPGIWALPIPGFGIENDVRDPGIPNPIPTYELSIVNRVIERNRRRTHETTNHQHHIYQHTSQLTVNDGPLSWHRAKRNCLFAPTSAGAVFNQTALARQYRLAGRQISGVQKIRVRRLIFVAIRENFVGNDADSGCQLCRRFTTSARRTFLLQGRHHCLFLGVLTADSAAPCATRPPSVRRLHTTNSRLGSRLSDTYLFGRMTTRHRRKPGRRKLQWQEP